MLKSLLDRFVSWVLNAAPFVAIGAYLAVEWMRKKNETLDAKIRFLELKRQEEQHAKEVSERLRGLSDSDIIDLATSKGSKMPEPKRTE